MTPASDRKPTTRKVLADVQRNAPPRPFVLQIGERTMTLRPAGCRASGPASVTVTYASVYERALIVRASLAASAKRAKRRGAK
jgi:hypothetical protein